MNATAAQRQRLPAPIIQHCDPPHDVARLRPGEFRRLFRRRHGPTFPFDDEGRRDRDIVLDSLVQSGADNARQQTISFLRECCPWMAASEHSDAIDRAIRRRKFWDKSELGNALGLTWEERDACRITTIRPMGATDADMAERRKTRNTIARQMKRRQQTLHPLEEASLPAIRAKVIADLMKPRECCAVAAVCKELRRTRHIRFAQLRDKALSTAVHNAIDYGVKQGFLRKDVDRSGRVPVASVTKIGGSP